MPHDKDGSVIKYETFFESHRSNLLPYILFISQLLSILPKLLRSNLAMIKGRSSFFLNLPNRFQWDVNISKTTGIEKAIKLPIVSIQCLKIVICFATNRATCFFTWGIL